MIRTMHSDFGVVLTPTLLHSIVRPGLGYLFSFLFTVLFAAILWNHRKLRSYYGFTFAGAIALVVGAWFWLIETGATQIRFFTPLLAMAVVFWIPACLEILRIIPRRIVLAVRLLLIASAVNLGLLLPQLRPNETWQKWSGINITSGIFETEIVQANQLLNEIRTTGTTADVYAFDIDPSTAAFFSVGNYSGLIEPHDPTFVTHLPVDWIRPSVYRLEEMRNSRYLLFKPILEKRMDLSALSIAPAADFWQEQYLFREWLSALTSKDGIALVSETSVRLIKITDNSRFDAALGRFLSRHKWRSIFIEANHDILNRYRLQQAKTSR
jgi:hypothetical protein